MMLENIVTYQSLIDKYPQMKEDIEKLKASKNYAVKQNRIAFFVLGLITSTIIYIFLG